MTDRPENERSALGDILAQTRDDIVVPKTKEVVNNMFVDIIYMMGDYFSNVVGKIIFGKDAVQTRTSGQNNRNRYSNISRSGVAQQPQPIGARSSTDLQYVYVDSEATAKKICDEMIQSINTYGKVRVADLYEKSGKVKPIFTDFNFGWTNPNDIHYTRNRDGWWFNMPSPVKLNG